MKKYGNYFPHFSNARHDPKIIDLRRKYGDVGYAYYFMILEVLRDQQSFKIPIKNIGTVAYDIRVDVELLNDIIYNSELFIVDDEYFYSIMLIQLIQPMIERSNRAISANHIRWNKQKQIFNPNGDPNGDPINKEINKTIKQRKDSFIFNVKLFENKITTKDYIQSFIAYWCQIRKDQKMYFEASGEFDIKQKLREWVLKPKK